MIRSLQDAPPQGGGTRKQLHVHCVIGTRPEAIKMASVVHALAADGRFSVRVICTGQHREMVADLLPVLKLKPDLNLDLMTAGQTAGYIVGRVTADLGAYWRQQKPDLVLVQGDTGSALGGALAACYERIPVGHVEAGLRTFDPLQPFPEEINRVMIARVASLHFCPTPANRRNLLDEGVDESTTFICGNTGIDTFLETFHRAAKESPAATNGEHLILVTAHRRENVDHPFNELCRALATIARSDLGARIVFPVHPNPRLREASQRHLGRIKGIELTEPLRYDRFVHLMSRATLLLTDSGGIQEEASVIGKPALVLRNVTERQEGLNRGPIRLINADAEEIVEAVTELLTNAAAREKLSRPTTCFGDGRAAGRVVAAIKYAYLEGEKPDDYRHEDANSQVCVPQ